MTLEILGISGSLRARSSNTEVLRAVALLAPASVRVTLEAGLDLLPYFNPDLDQEGMILPPAVQAFRSRVDNADAILICSPEYAHGVPGVLKNALDWLVSGPEAIYKPVGVLNASPRSTHAHASLVETLRTMSMTLVPAASITVSLSGRSLDATAIAADPSLAAALRGALGAFEAPVGEYRLRRPASSS